MFNLRAGDAYCYFNRHYLILKFSECASAFLKGDVIAPPIGSRTLLFPPPIAPFSTASASCPLPALVNPARLKVQKLLRSFVRKNVRGRGIARARAEEKRAPEERIRLAAFSSRSISAPAEQTASKCFALIDRLLTRAWRWNPKREVRSRSAIFPATLRGEPLDHSSLEISDGPRKILLPHAGSFATKGAETDGRKRRGIEPLNSRPDK